MDIYVSRDATLSWTPSGGAERHARCAIGHGGIGKKMREGDGVTPAGRWPLRRLHYRADRLELPQTGLPGRNIVETDGWCDDPHCDNYNRLVTLPHEGSHERMRREDGLYDVVVEIGYNDSPVVPGLGSAIFLHIAHPDYKPTEGCVALALDDMLDLLGDCDGDDWLVIG